MAMDDANYRIWKTQLVPLLYDWLCNHHLTWPSQACRWGARLEEAAYKTKHRMYLSEQTDGSEPNKLVVYTAEVPKPRMASAETVTSWNEYSKSGFVKEAKVLFHPGEVNKIRELPGAPGVIVTHSDVPELYVWNVDRQPSRLRADDPAGKEASVPDLVLKGHSDVAQFALSTCRVAPCVASGGQDKRVLVWNLSDKLSGLKAGSLGGSGGAKEAPNLDARVKLEGHKATVEDVVFKASSEHELASVGDDRQLMMWDTRSPAKATAVVKSAHKDDIQAVDWSRPAEHLLATGDAQGVLKVWDVRQLGAAAAAPLHTFSDNSEPIMRVEWHPTDADVLASGGEDRTVSVWHLGRPAGHRIFSHVGHRSGKVVDFQWCEADPWSLLSVSDDTEAEELETGSAGGGGTAQVWRMSDLIYRPEEECLAELNANRQFIEKGENKSIRAGAEGAIPAM